MTHSSWSARLEVDGYSDGFTDSVWTKLSRGANWADWNFFLIFSIKANLSHVYLIIRLSYISIKIYLIISFQFTQSTQKLKKRSKVVMTRKINLIQMRKQFFVPQVDSKISTELTKILCILKKGPLKRAGFYLTFGLCVGWSCNSLTVARGSRFVRWRSWIRTFRVRFPRDSGAS